MHTPNLMQLRGILRANSDGVDGAIFFPLGANSQLDDPIRWNILLPCIRPDEHR